MVQLLSKSKNVITNRSYFIFILLVVSTLQKFGSIQNWVEPFYDIVAIWGIIFVIFTISKYIKINIVQYLPLIMFLFSYAITIVLRGFNLSDIKVWSYTLIFFYTLFVWPEKTKEAVDKSINSFFRIVLVIASFNMIISLVMYYMRYQSVMSKTWLSWSYHWIGVHYNSSLYGLIANSNWLSYLSISGVAACAYFYSKSSKRAKVILLITSFFHIYAVILSNSRGGLIGMGVLLSVYYFLKSDRKKLVKSIVSLAIFISVFLLSFGVTKLDSHLFLPIAYKLGAPSKLLTSRELIDRDIKKAPIINEEDGLGSTKNNDNTIPLVSANYSYINFSTTHTSAEKEPDNGRYEDEKSRSTITRIEYAKAGLRVFKEYPVFGIGRHGIEDVIPRYLPSNVIQRDVKNLSNIYIQVLTATGIVGFILLFGFIGYVYVSGCRIFTLTNRKEKNTLSIIMALISMFLVTNLVESEIILSKGFPAVYFWLLLGYVHVYTKIIITRKG